MKPLNLFSPLNRLPGFTTPPFDLRIGDIRYDLIVPDDIGDLLQVHVTTGTSYRRHDRYCDTAGIEAIRARPWLLDVDFSGVPAYAIALADVEDVQGDGAVIAYIAQRLVLGPIASRQIYNRGRLRSAIHPALADYIVSRDGYFENCGGFELLRLSLPLLTSRPVSNVYHLASASPAI